MQTTFSRYCGAWLLGDLRKCISNISGSPASSVQLNARCGNGDRTLRNHNTATKHNNNNASNNCSGCLTASHDCVQRHCHHALRSAALDGGAPILINSSLSSTSCRSHQVNKRTFCGGNPTSACSSSTSNVSDGNMQPQQQPQQGKKFSFYDYDVIGFDLDNTLLRYNLNEMLPLVYRNLCEFLVEAKHYPPQLTEQRFDADFLQRGLVLDSDHGNVLKLSNNSSILRATHGTKLLTRVQLIDIYGPELKWSVSTQFFHDPLSTWNGPLSAKLRTLLDYFDTPAGLVFAQAIDLLDAAGWDSAKPYNVWPDILDGLIQLYTREHFQSGASSYFRALRAEPERYLLRTSDSSLAWLKELRASGKALFLLTGSNVDFANFTATHALGPNWSDLFDCVVCYARKPGFFTMHRRFFTVRELQEVQGSELPLDQKLRMPAIYSQGNWRQMHASFAQMLGRTDEQTVRTLYVGDNLIQDTYTPVEHGDLDAVVLCEELYGDANYAHIDYEFRDMVNSKFWGSYFCVENEPTLWSSMIGDFSKLCVASIDELAKESISHHFISKNKHGFFPESPADLIVKHVTV